MKQLFINAFVATDERIEFRVIRVENGEVTHEDRVFESEDAVSRFKWQVNSRNPKNQRHPELPDIPQLLLGGFAITISIDHNGRSFYDPRYWKGFRSDVLEIIRHNAYIHAGEK